MFFFENNYIKLHQKKIIMNFFFLIRKEIFKISELMTKLFCMFIFVIVIINIVFIIIMYCMIAYLHYCSIVFIIIIFIFIIVFLYVNDKNEYCY